ncbi:MAG TPA: hypothetical protein VF444_05465, partial [Pseudonocardiaceae bacterium]
MNDHTDDPRSAGRSGWPGAGGPSGPDRGGVNEATGAWTPSFDDSQPIDRVPDDGGANRQGRRPGPRRPVRRVTKGAPRGGGAAGGRAGGSAAG